MYPTKFRSLVAATAVWGPSDLNHRPYLTPQPTIVLMLLPRHKLVSFHLESLGPSADAPACEDLRLIALLEGSDGSRFERSKTILAYPGIMRDAEQFPFFLASEVRALMTA